MNPVAFRKTNPFNRYSFVNAVRVQARVVQNDNATERMSDQANREVADDVQQHRKVKNMLSDAVHSAGRPGAVAVAAQVQGVDVIVRAQRSCHPVPAPGVVKAAVDKDKGRLPVLTKIPEL